MAGAPTIAFVAADDGGRLPLRWSVIEPDVPLLAHLVDDGVGTSTPSVDRRAVRAVARREGELLMVLSTRRGDYKFPGGGVKPGEADGAALARELAEECGARLAGVDGVLGDTLEHRAPLEAGGPALKMVSRYFRCRIEAGLGAQSLDPYEEDLGFRPVWVTPEHALAANEAVLRTGADDGTPAPPWTRREVLVLRRLLDRREPGQR